MINDLAGLEQLLKLLREQGVTMFRHGNLEIELEIKETVSSYDFMSPEEEKLDAPEFPSQAELDRAVNMPVGDIEDPFLTYNEQSAE